MPVSTRFWIGLVARGRILSMCPRSCPTSSPSQHDVSCSSGGVETGAPTQRLQTRLCQDCDLPQMGTTKLQVIVQPCYIAWYWLSLLTARHFASQQPSPNLALLDLAFSAEDKKDNKRREKRNDHGTKGRRRDKMTIFLSSFLSCVSVLLSLLYLFNSFLLELDSPHHTQCPHAPYFSSCTLWHLP